ncbi:CehA/McbA family metallohydrolase [Haloechinothrix halophila]|uniref:CehA/McbA family metallohydrolase n=1 Tax=Haloechinothrix halophila TaxID=1069073 RepID=UPI00040CFF57|nr:CehA/McbA family metallohydrolase [Haloechinothrix halophila]
MSDELSRRAMLRRGAVLTTGVAGLGITTASPAVAASELTLTATAAGAGTYLYLPFPVPAGVNRVAASLTKSGAGAEHTAVGIGLFDERGPGYGSPGFRGVYGEEENSFFVAAHAASRAFRAGRIEPGTWTVIIPVFRAPTPTELTVTVRLSFGPQRGERPLGREQDVVRAEPGWYRGDLHNHTTHSSDAFASGSALQPDEYPDAMRRAGLDWVVFTDHNVTTSNDDLARIAGDTGVLLIGGVEMTNWFHGHATVSGLPPGAWLDWRQRPNGIPLQRYERRIDAFFDAARRHGAYVSAAHPASAHLSWQFLADGLADPALLPDGLEVWNGPYQPDDDDAIAIWDRLLAAGHRVFASGGSDLHGTANPEASALGAPTTVVYAGSLSRDAVVAALKAGRSYVTSGPSGPELYLTAEGPAGQHAMVGGTVTGGPADVVTVSVLVRGGTERVLTLLRDGLVVRTEPVTADEQTVTLDQPIGPGGYLRAELRGAPEPDTEDPLNGRSGMVALTNPIFLAPE